jgi:hypothetical protein
MLNHIIDCCLNYVMHAFHQANYQFAYRVHATGKGYGDDSGENRGYGGNDAEFGHSETRNGQKTTGAYFVELPDGRLQRVDYYVDGDSGYVARVSYSGSNGASGEKGGHAAAAGDN